MTKDFIEKRIYEQKQYIQNQMQRYLDGKITFERSLDIIASASGQYQYFIHELNKLKK